MSSQFLAEYDELHSGSQAGFPNRWSAANFFDKVIAVNSSFQPLYWPGGGLARPLPGLPDARGWDGVEEIAGHLILWKDEVIKYSDVNDFSTWIPISVTAVSLAVETLEEFQQPGPGEASVWVHYADDSAAFVEGMFVRIDLEENDPVAATFNFYTVSEVSSPVGRIADSIEVSQTIAAGATDTIYTTAPVLIGEDYEEWPEGGKLLLNGQGSDLQITDSSRAVSLLLTLAEESEEVPVPGGTFHVTVSENPSDLRAGDVLSLGEIAATGLDLYRIRENGFTMTLERLNIGTRKQSLGYKFPANTYALVQPYVVVENSGSVDEVVSPSTTLTMQGAVKLTPTGSTGEIPVGTTIPARSTIRSLDANEAGEFVNAGSQINGRVFAVVSLGEYGVILKEKSIQSMQYVGRLNGVFFTRPEVLDEGPMGKYTWCRLADNKLAILGGKNLYSYAGGQSLEPLGTQHTPALFKDLDRSRVDEIVMFHNEKDKQIWIAYPSLTESDSQVFIYNYEENTCVIDKYSSSLGGITALGALDWEAAPAWEDLEDSITWTSETRRWYELVESGLQKWVIIAVGGDASDPNLGELPDTEIPRLLLHGRTYGRASGDNCSPAAYYCLAETQDYDFGDSSVFKYLHTIELNLAIDEELDRPMKLYVQVGSRDNLDSTIRWSAPASVEASGNGNYTTDVNIRAAGRFHRIRFYSNQVGAQWKIAGFTLYARPGGAY